MLFLHTLKERGLYFRSQHCIVTSFKKFKGNYELISLKRCNPNLINRFVITRMIHMNSSESEDFGWNIF